MYALNSLSVNSSLHIQNGYNSADDIFRCMFVNEKDYIAIKLSLKFVPQDPIDNSLTLV